VGRGARRSMRNAFTGDGGGASVKDK
jgi:hypothetical protein